jgi:hypothetical protein
MKGDLKMGKIFLENDVAIILESVEGEGDLKSKPGLMNINPPPKDGKCECCGKHMSELKPFGKAGDPLVGDFDEALLVKKFRTALPPSDDETKRIYEQSLIACDPHSNYDKPREHLIKEYGERDAEIIMVRLNGGSQVGSSWECRDCAALDIYEYFEKLGYDLDEYYSWKPGQQDKGKVSEV